MRRKDDLDYLVEDFMDNAEDYDITLDGEHPEGNLRKLLKKVLGNADLKSIEDSLNPPF